LKKTNKKIKKQYWPRKNTDIRKHSITDTFGLDYKTLPVHFEHSVSVAASLPVGLNGRPVCLY